MLIQNNVGWRKYFYFFISNALIAILFMCICGPLLDKLLCHFLLFFFFKYGFYCFCRLIDEEKSVRDAGGGR